MTSATMRRPERSEAADYYFHYIDQVDGSDIVGALTRQRDELLALLRSVPAARSDYRYADDKWTLAEAVGHITDTERVFCGRAFWFARSFDAPLPSFDQNVAVSAGRFEERTWESLLDEFAAVREASITLFASLPPEAWDRSGVASGKSVTVRALAFMVAGHAAHHLEILRTRYLK